MPGRPEALWRCRFDDSPQTPVEAETTSTMALLLVVQSGMPGILVRVARTIESANALTDVFGRWPSFHDGEVLSISLDRDGVSGAEITAAIHVFEPTSEVTDDGFYRLRNHTRVTLSFEGVEEVELAGVAEQITDRPPMPEGDQRRVDTVL